MKILATLTVAFVGGILAAILWLAFCFTTAAFEAQSSGDPTGGGAYAALFLITSPVAFAIGAVLCGAAFAISGKIGGK